jgi:hypothetical protein
MTLDLAIEKLRTWRLRPDVFVREVFGVTPDPWQDEILKAFPSNQRIAMAACKGPGKTCVLAWLMWNFMLTRPNPKIAATSITGDNLSDGLWTEIAVWMNKSKMLKEKFTWTKTRVFANDAPETWFMSARPWSRSGNAAEQGNTLAGLHADYILFVLDESGGIPDAVMVAADAALSSCIEGHIVQAGNPTHLSGPLYRACTSERRLWHVIEISSAPDDPNRTPRVSVQWAQEQIDKYGRDNPWVLINVFGQFPPSSLNSLISLDEVKEATQRYYRPQEYSMFARVLGCDVAAEGGDSSVIFPRQGPVAFTPVQYRNINGTEGADLVARKWVEWDAHACFIDNTGGFGSSWLDNLRRLGYAPIGVHFSEKSLNPKYFNKRTEMIFDCVEWIKNGGAIPNIPELVAAITQTTYTHKGEKMIIEPKDLLKVRLGYSPDHFDSLALTFASPVSAATERAGTGRHQINYNPLDLEYVKRSTTNYNPLDLDYLRGGG